MNSRLYLGGLSVLLVITALGTLIYTARHATSPITDSPVTKTFEEIVEDPPVTPIEQTVLIFTETPLPNQKVTSPLIVSGNARGYWYFEASFPIELVDANGVRLAISPAQAQGDWMTENFVPFSATLTWSSASTTATSGTLILHRDNPSGMPENDDEISLPVIF